MALGRALRQRRRAVVLCCLAALYALIVHVDWQTVPHAYSNPAALVHRSTPSNPAALVHRSTPSNPAATRCQLSNPAALVHRRDATWCQLRDAGYVAPWQHLLACGDLKHQTSAKVSQGSEKVTHEDDKLSQVCQQPILDPCHAAVREFDYWVSPVSCTNDTDWVFIDNGTFHIAAAAKERHGDIVCEYTPLARGIDDFSVVHRPLIKPMLDGSPITKDFFKVACNSSKGSQYYNTHLAVAKDHDVMERLKHTPLAPNALGYHVLILGFDSVSRMSMYRNMPQTLDFLINTLGVVQLEGYNIVGDGTDKALMPILTGHTEKELPCAIQGVSKRTVDGFPWIWKEFRDAGYVTAWAEDMAGVGTFQYRYNGFKDPPVDHYCRPYYIYAETNMNHRFNPWCLGSTPRITRMTDWVTSLVHMYPSHPRFTIAFHSENSHGDNNNLKAIDALFLQFLKSLHATGGLKKTVLVVMSDHGARFANIRATEQGKLEERNPFFSIYFPPSFRRRHARVYDTLVANRHRLVTPFDVHVTLRDLINFTHVGDSDIMARGISLFSPIPAARTCHDAGIAPHWCACLDWEDVTSHPPKGLIKSILAFLNDVTSQVRNLCARLEVHSVKSVKRMRVGSDVLRFKKSSDFHGHIPDMSDVMTRDLEQFQVTLVTSPGGGMFEVAASRSEASPGGFSVSQRTVSRINRYGDAPWCVADSLPHLRPFCFCV